jgi:hypothetical protein
MRGIGFKECSVVLFLKIEKKKKKKKKHGALGECLARGPKTFTYIYLKPAIHKQGIFLKQLGYQNKASWD